MLIIDFFLKGIRTEVLRRRVDKDYPLGRFSDWPLSMGFIQGAQISDLFI